MQKEGEAGENSSYRFTKLLQVRHLISFNLDNDPVKDGLLYVGGNSGLGRLSY